MWLFKEQHCGSGRTTWGVTADTPLLSRSRSSLFKHILGRSFGDDLWGWDHARPVTVMIPGASDMVVVARKACPAS